MATRQTTTTRKPAAKKAAPKKAPAKAEAKAVGYEAGPARCGKTNVRTSTTPLTHAVDVQDPKHPSKLWQQGVITRFFVGVEAAQQYADAMTAKGCNVVILPAKAIA